MLQKIHEAPQRERKKMRCLCRGKLNSSGFSGLTCEPKIWPFQAVAGISWQCLNSCPSKIKRRCLQCNIHHWSMIFPVINGHLVRRFEGRVQKWETPMKLHISIPIQLQVQSLPYGSPPYVCRWCSCFFASLKRIFQLAMFDCQWYYPIFHWYSTNIPVVFHAYVLQQYTISPFNIYMSYSSIFF